MYDTPNGYSESEDLAFRQLIARHYSINDQVHAYNLAIADASGALTGEVINYLRESAK